MKILFSHLKRFLPNDININTISDSLFKLGHEHEIDQEIFDIEFTPNKGDCLSVYGLARDLNAIHDVNLKLDLYEDHIDELELKFKNSIPDFCSNISFLKIEIDKPVIKYKDYLDDYFKNFGISKNNFFTDISNYLAYEIGQPTHCYDFNEVKDGFELALNKSHSSFQTLIGEVINLPPGEQVFVKGNEIINLAGVMGGESTKCADSSVKVLVECAFFNPDMIIGKSVKYDLNSDAAYKFERGTDPSIHDFALRRFIRIVQDHANIKSIAMKCYESSINVNRYINKDYKKINKILGTNLKDNVINNILEDLGFVVEERFKIPTWRSDIESINDLAEEVARVLGYDNISNSKIEISNNIIKNSSSKINKIRRLMISNGFNEIINDPFVGDMNNNAVKVDNPLDSNRQFLRLNLINSLITNLDYNEKRQKESIKFFEISDIYEKNKINEPRKVFSIIVSGRRGYDHLNFNRKLDRKYLADIIKKLGIDESQIKEIPRDSFNSKIKNPIFFIECDISNVNEDLISKESFNMQDMHFNKFEAISELPSSIRDISVSFSNKDNVKFAIESVFNVELENNKDLFIFDFYNNKDKNILKIGFRFIFQSKNRTLKENDIDKEMKKVFAMLLKIDGVEIPGLTDL